MPVKQRGTVNSIGKLFYHAYYFIFDDGHLQFSLFAPNLQNLACALYQNLWILVLCALFQSRSFAFRAHSKMAKPYLVSYLCLIKLDLQKTLMLPFAFLAFRIFATR